MDDKLTHLPGEGEGTPLLPTANTPAIDANDDAEPARETGTGKPVAGEPDLVPPGTSPGTGQ